MAPQARVAGQVDDAETAFADQAFDHVFLQRVAQGQGSAANDGPPDQGGLVVLVERAARRHGRVGTHQRPSSISKN